MHVLDIWVFVVRFLGYILHSILWVCRYGLLGFMVKLYLYARKYVFGISNVRIVECVRLIV